ncbi:T9SS type A sorting domain-containing protein [Flavobacterium antarcticum]|uniref:T9SS type A sorting domain-containing protein n=1 Tax=Flavobacterium antarcticum TaxID=271155 RepID=UPI0003B3B6E6|nr:T9SS type A sorting domain-containing protein [Flavobacterium antarcticum]
MKRILLTLALSASTIAFSQTLQTESFNALTIGNIGTDITGTTIGQGSWLTFSSDGAAPTTSTNSAANNYQVVATGNGSTQGLQITSPNGDKGQRFMWKDGLDASWASRTTGNNIIEVEYDFFTGPVTDSRTQIGMRAYGDETVGTVVTSRTIVGFVYTTNTRVLGGVAYLKNGASNGTFLITLGATPLILNANTWYTIGCSYNTITGETMWKTSPTATPNGLPAVNWIPNMVPNEVDFVQVVVGANATAVPPVPANTVTSNMLFDNYVARASATNTLLGVNDFVSVETNVISVYPNPATDLLNVATNGSDTINAVQIVDLNGREVFTKSFSNVSDAQINVNDLSAGMYLINIKSGDKSVTKKFLKQ